MNAGMPNEGGVAVIEFGGNDCDLDWKGSERTAGNRAAGESTAEAVRERI